MRTIREAIIDRMMKPYGVTAAEALAIEGVEQGCQIVENRHTMLMITGGTGTEVGSHTSHPMRSDDVRGQIAEATSRWLPLILNEMRRATLREQGRKATARPHWSILVNPITLATAVATGIPAGRLAHSDLCDGKPVFPGLHDAGFEDHASTSCYQRDFSHHEGADYLRGVFAGTRADYVANHALQLLEDTRFPIRSVTDQGGASTMIEIRGLLPESTCVAMVGRPLSDVIDLPGFEPGTAAGSTCVMKAATRAQDGRTILEARRRHVPAITPPRGADMRWAMPWTAR